MGPVVPFLWHIMVVTELDLSHCQTQDKPDLLDNIDWSQAPQHLPSSPEVSSSLRWCLQWSLRDVSTDRSLAGSWTPRYSSLSGQLNLLGFPVSSTLVLELLFLLYGLGTRALAALPVSLLSYQQGVIRSVILPPGACALSLRTASLVPCQLLMASVSSHLPYPTSLLGLADWVSAVCLIAPHLILGMNMLVKKTSIILPSLSLRSLESEEGWHYIVHGWWSISVHAYLHAIFLHLWN